MVTSLLDLKMTCTWVGRSVGNRGPLLGITVNSCATSEGVPSVASNVKLKLISNLPLFFREHDCFVSSSTLRTPKSRPPSAPGADEQRLDRRKLWQRRYNKAEGITVGLVRDVGKIVTKLAKVKRK